MCRFTLEHTMKLNNGHVVRKGAVTPMGNVLWKVFKEDVLMDIFWTKEDTPLAEVREKAERSACHDLPLNQSWRRLPKLTLISVPQGRSRRFVFAWVEYTHDGRAAVSEEWLAETFGLRRGDCYWVG